MRRRESCAILAASFLALAVQRSARGQQSKEQKDEKPARIDIETLRKQVDAKKDMFFIDVREPKEIEELGSLKGYVNIPVGQIESRLNEIPKDRYIVTA
ncbi:MAG TPA: hypothetical protein VFA54_08455 [Bryobacterales bacterium]|jgi:hypothetical protein|nr:hypothetical protein [Bryobacterales bacterium]